MAKQNRTIEEIAEVYTNKTLSYESTPKNPSEVYEWVKAAFIAGAKNKSK